MSLVYVGRENMFLWDLFKKEKHEETIKENPHDLENEYLTIKPSDRIYGFQEKFYKQSGRLLNTFGYAKDSIPNLIKLIIITDTHNTLNEDDLVNTINSHQDYDLCLLLGDHSDSDINKVLKNVPKDKIYALLGNHDNDYISRYELNNLNGNIIDINEVKLLGIQGSFKYKPIDFPSFTQEDSIKFLKDKDPVDILISHDGPFDDNMINNPAHQGLFGITYYLYKNHVKYNIHGHLHEEYEKILDNGTIEKCLYEITYIELN